MADFDRRPPYRSGYDGRFEKEYRYGNGNAIGADYHHKTYGKGAGYNNRTDYDGSFANERQNDHNVVVPHNPGVYRTYELRNQYGSSEPRRLEVVKGNVFSINQIFVTPPRETPYRPPLALPEPNEETKARPTWFSDPEMKRKRRVASYKAYSVEGKVKASLKKSFRWIRYKCSELIHGW